MRICPRCGVSFETRSAVKVYCSPECAKAAKARRRRESAETVRRKCKLCGKEFTVSRDRRKYCSPECMEAHITATTKHRRFMSDMRKRRNRAPGVRVCRICGKEFESTGHWERRYYCSAECLAEARRRQYRANFPRYRRGLKQCSCCHRLIKRGHTVWLKIDGKKLRFCSEKCRDRIADPQTGRKPDEYVCECCGETFLRFTDRTKYCSPVCRVRAASERAKEAYRASREEPPGETPVQPTVCRHCGKPLPWNADSLYCSTECLVADLSAKVEVARHEHGRVVKRVCPECGKEFTADNLIQRYCSEACSKASLRRRKLARIDRIKNEDPERWRKIQADNRDYARKRYEKLRAEFKGEELP